MTSTNRYAAYARPCDCHRYPNMHDENGVCVAWDSRGHAVPFPTVTPCPRWHYAYADGTRKRNGYNGDHTRDAV